MFDSTKRSQAPSRSPLRLGLLHAADLVIALVTLESYGLDDLSPRAAQAVMAGPATPADARASSRVAGHRGATGTALITELVAPAPRPPCARPATRPRPRGHTQAPPTPYGACTASQAARDPG